MAIQLTQDSVFHKSPPRDVILYNIILNLKSFKIIFEAEKKNLPSPKSHYKTDFVFHLSTYPNLYFRNHITNCR